jgi:hypothetical protein
MMVVGQAMRDPTETARINETTVIVYTPPVVTKCRIILYTDPNKEWVNLKVYVDDYTTMTKLVLALPYITGVVLHGIEYIPPPLRC